MLNKDKVNKLNEFIELANTNDKQLSKMNYKDKQKVFKAKSKLCKLVFVSNDKKGKGKTYIKPKEVNKNE